MNRKALLLLTAAALYGTCQMKLSLSESERMELAVKQARLLLDEGLKQENELDAVMQ